MALMFEPASSRTVPFFHLSSFRAATVCCTSFKEGCSRSAGPVGAAIGVGASSAGDCIAKTRQGEHAVVKTKTMSAARINCAFLILQSSAKLDQKNLVTNARGTVRYLRAATQRPKQYQYLRCSSTSNGEAAIFSYPLLNRELGRSTPQPQASYSRGRSR